jgi:hypothetical protein
LSKTNRSIEREEQKINRMEANLAKLKLKERRADTRRKIQLGGLAIKAKIADEPAAVILGILIDAAKKMNSDATLRDTFKTIGDTAFKKDT